MPDFTALYIVTVCGSGFLALAIAVIASIIRLAKKAEIGEGVTLLQGIRACFGEDGVWGISSYGLVSVHVGDPRLIFVVQVIRGPGKAYRLIPHISDHHHQWADIDERDVAFGIMVEAVKEQETMIQM